MKFYSKPNKLIQEERTEQLQTKNLQMVRWKIVVNIIYFVIFFKLYFVQEILHWVFYSIYNIFLLKS